MLQKSGKLDIFFSAKDSPFTSNTVQVSLVLLVKLMIPDISPDLEQKGQDRNNKAGWGVESGSEEF